MYSQSTLFRENLALIQFGVRHEKDWNFAWTLFRKNQRFRPIVPKIFFVPKISPRKVGVIRVVIDKGVKRHMYMLNITIYYFKKKPEIIVYFLLSTYSFSTLESNSLGDLVIASPNLE